MNRPKKKRYPETLTTRDILAILRSGVYQVDLESGTVSRNGRELTPYANEDGYLFVQLYHEQKRKTISVSKVVWMAGSGRSVPRGFEIHHRDRNPENNWWSNLFALHNTDHRKLHNGADLLEDDFDDEVPF